MKIMKVWLVECLVVRHQLFYMFFSKGTTRIVPSDFEITEKYELVRVFSSCNTSFQGQMSLFYFGKVGNVLMYINICAYLYGDLTIYSSAVPKSLRNVIWLVRIL